MMIPLLSLMHAACSREGFFIAGMALIAYGAFLIYPPLAFLAPGAVLVWFTVPSRPPFFGSAPRAAKQERT